MYILSLTIIPPQPRLSFCPHLASPASRFDAPVLAPPCTARSWLEDQARALARTCLRPSADPGLLHQRMPLLHNPFHRGHTAASHQPLVTVTCSRPQSLDTELRGASSPASMAAQQGLPGEFEVYYGEERMVITLDIGNINCEQGASARGAVGGADGSRQLRSPLLTCRYAWGSGGQIRVTYMSRRVVRQGARCAVRHSLPWRTHLLAHSKRTRLRPQGSAEVSCFFSLVQDP